MDQTTLLIQIVGFIIIGVVLIRDGYLAVIQKQSVLRWPDHISIKIARRIQGEKAAKEMQMKYQNPKLRFRNGIIDLGLGIVCLIMSVFSIFAFLQLY